MLLKPKRNFLIKAFFHQYMLFKIRKHFHEINFKLLNTYNNSKTLLIISNHYSWWDGFILYYLTHTYLKKNFHIIVNQDNYLKNKWFKYIGAIGIPKNPKEKLQTITFCKQILNLSNNVLCVFPQGKLYSKYIHELTLTNGWNKLVKNDVETLFVHHFTDYFDKPKPSLYIYVETFDNSKCVVNAYKDSYKTAKLQHIQLKK